MSEITKPDLSGVAGTLLITLYIRAIESQRPDALVKDERAEELVRQLDQESLRKTTALTADYTRAVMILKSREFDRFTQDFLRRHPEAVVVHIGCGLDTRFDRVDNGQVEWYDLDLPEVIELRRKFIGGEGQRYHLLSCSVLEDGWLETVSVHLPRPFLFVAEGVFMYFKEAQVKSLVLRLCDRFPGEELVFDAYSPFLYRSHNLRVTRKRVGVHLHWALKHSQDLEQWSVASGTGAASSTGAANSPGAGIRLLDERYPFQYSEPRIRNALPVRLVYPLIAKGLGVFHYHL
jgi:O-methyltransferase involved in polyketide biosynthesis